jgi:hypothetical protein
MSKILHTKTGAARDKRRLEKSYMTGYSKREKTGFSITQEELDKQKKEFYERTEPIEVVKNKRASSDFYWTN